MSTPELQAVFDTVINHLFKQGRPALQKNEMRYDSCKYRTDDGLKCAVGCLIPDELHDPSLEGKAASELIYGSAGEPVTDLLNKLVGPSQSRGAHLLDELQAMHDSWNPEASGWAYIQRWADRIARQAGLTFNDPSLETQP